MVSKSIDQELRDDRLDEFGHEVPDPTPLRIPSGFRRPETLQEQVARLVRGSISREAADAGFETFEESEDFDVDDEFDPRTPFEVVFDPILGEVTPHDLQKFEGEYRRKYLSLQESAFEAQDHAANIAAKMKALVRSSQRDFRPNDPPRRGEARRPPDPGPGPEDQ